MPARILIAGIGNIFLGDDAFGSEVARRLARRPVADGVRVVDFGVRGLDLAYALMDGSDTNILVDATPRDGPPGTLYVIEPDLETLKGPGAVDVLIEAHDMVPGRVLRLAAAMGGPIGRVLLVGCEPAAVGSLEEPVMGLSPMVERAVDEAVELIDALVAKLLKDERPAHPSPGAS